MTKPNESMTLVELPAVVTPLTHLRGTTLVASLGVLEEQGIAHAFWQRLPAGARDAIQGLVAASWVELELAMIYYRTLDSLQLADDTVVSIGRAAAMRVQSPFVSTLVRGMRGTITPATVLARMDKLYERNFRGGAVRVSQPSPKDLLLEIHGAPFLDLRYTRVALRGYYEETLVSTARTLYLRELPQPRPGTAVWKLSWV